MTQQASKYQRPTFLAIDSVCYDVKLLTSQAILQAHPLPTTLHLDLVKALARQQAELHWKLQCMSTE